MSPRLAAEHLLRLKAHHLPEGYASHEGEPYVRLHVPIPVCMPVEEARAWCALMLAACGRAEDECEEMAMAAAEERRKDSLTSRRAEVGQ